MVKSLQIELNERELREDIPDWLPGRFPPENQLKLFVRWVCRIHYGTSEAYLSRHLGLGNISPFRPKLRGTPLRRACFELAVFLGRSLEIEDLQTKHLMMSLEALQLLPVTEGEYGDWHRLADSLRKVWVESHGEEQ